MGNPFASPSLDPSTMVNLRPASTGLPMVVWVSERGDAPHDVRVEVCRDHGDTIQPNNTASVAVRPEPLLLTGNLWPADLTVVNRWITLNADAIVAYWDGAIDTAELMQWLRKLDPPITP